MAFGKFIDIELGDLSQRQAQLISAGRYVPENVAELVFEFPADIIVDHAAVIALDLFDDVGNLARFARKTERRIFEVV